MTVWASPSESREVWTGAFPTGGTIAVRVRDGAGADALARTSVGVTEDIAGSGVRRYTLTAPSTVGQYEIVWDNGTSYDLESLTVTSSGAPPSASGTDYITLAALKSTLSMTGVTFADADLTVAISAASRAVDKLCARRFWPDSSDQTRYYSADRVRKLEIDDLITLTTLASDDDNSMTYANSWASGSDFVLSPYNAAADGEPYTAVEALPSGNFTFHNRYPKSVKLTGLFGWSAVPVDVVSATTFLAARIVRLMREAPFGVVAFDGMVYHVAKADSNVMMLIGPYMRHKYAIA